MMMMAILPGVTLGGSVMLFDTDPMLVEQLTQKPEMIVMMNLMTMVNMMIMMSVAGFTYSQLVKPSDHHHHHSNSFPFHSCSDLVVDETSMMIFHIVFSNDSHFHLFSFHFLSLKLTVRKGQPLPTWW